MTNFQKASMEPADTGSHTKKSTSTYIKIFNAKSGNIFNCFFNVRLTQMSTKAF